jgi:DNA-binding transcriptional regulator LsrR (DeoR family)
LQPQRSPGPAELVETGLIARRYYLEHKTKKEIGEELGISRFQVARLLDAAIESGLVTITVSTPTSIDIELSDRVRSAYQLRRAVVAVSPDETEISLRDTLGRVAGQLLREIVTADDVIGIGWGRTLEAMTAALSPLPVPCPVVQITGVVGSLTENSLELVRRLAAASGGLAYHFFAPLVVPDAHTASVLRNQPDVLEASSRFGTITVAVVSVGSWNPADSQLRNAIPDDERKVLEDLGVVAEICAVFLDRDGHTVRSETGSHCISISSEQLHHIEEVIAVAGGQSKVAAIRAVLRGGYVTTLVTDTIAARGLL